MKRQIFILTSLLFLCIGQTKAQNWHQISVPTNVKLNDIDFPSPTVGYIGGNDSTLLKTTDGGITWNKITYSGITSASAYNIIDLEFVSESVGYMICDWTSEFYKTIDGGFTWTPVTDLELGNICYKNSIYAFSEDHLFLGGAGCFQPAMIKEFSAPDWTGNYQSNAIESPTESFISDMDFSVNYAIASMSNNRMLRSVDGGQSWDTIPTGLNPGARLNEVLIVNDTLAYVAYSDTNLTLGLLLSDDMGQSWIQDFSNATFFYPNFLSLHQSDSGMIYSGAEYVFGESGLIFTNMDGQGWGVDQVDHAIYAIDSYLQNVVFAVGDSGYVVTNTPQLSLNIGEPGTLPLYDHILYPNPTDGVFKISSTHEGSVIIRDLAGRFIGEGKLNEEIDLSAQPAGVYLVQVDNQIYRVSVSR